MAEIQTDILVLGAGCAGLQLVYQLVTHPKYNQERIILVDQNPWGTAEKTWCFWRKEDEIIYPHIHSAAWSSVEVILPNKQSVAYPLQEYNYTQIKSQDFFKFHWDFFQQFPITFLQASIQDVSADCVQTSDGEIKANRIYSSVYTQEPAARHDLHLKQHFFGWIIETDSPVFSMNRLTLMDLSVPQPEDGMAFMYVLPYSDTQALIEFTVFSPTAWLEEDYQAYLTSYMKGRGEWRIVGQEKGIIPMYGGSFPANSPVGVQWIGGAGGQIKPSTGYAFYRIWEHTKSVVASYYQNTATISKKSSRFRAYDLWLLHILQYRPASSTVIFHALFSKVPLERTFKFLNEQTSLWEEMLLFSKLPKRLFLRAVWDRLPNIIS